MSTARAAERIPKTVGLLLEAMSSTGLGYAEYYINGYRDELVVFNVRSTLRVPLNGARHGIDIICDTLDLCRLIDVVEGQ
jgi:hypothetical protein